MQPPTLTHPIHAKDAGLPPDETVVKPVVVESSLGGWVWWSNLPHHPRSGTHRLEQTTCPNSNSSTPTLRVNEPQNTEWYSSTPCSCAHMKWTTLKTLSSMRRSRLTGSLSPLGWHFSLPEYGAVLWALCTHPIPLGSWRSRPLHRSCPATPAFTDVRIRGGQSHKSGRPLPRVVHKRSQEKDKHGDVSAQY